MTLQTNRQTKIRRWLWLVCLVLLAAGLGACSMRLPGLGNRYSTGDANFPDDPAPPAPAATRLPADGPVVRSLAFSPDGTLLAVAAGNGRDPRFAAVELVDMASSEVVRRLEGHRFMVWSVAFSPTGAWLASGSVDNTVRLWDVSSGEHLTTWEAEPLQGESSYQGVLSVSISPDGRQLAAANAETIWLLGLKGEGIGDVLLTLPNAEGGVAISPESDKLAAHSTKANLQVWNLQNGEEVLTIASEKGLCPPVYSPDGKTIAVCRRTGKIALLDADDGALRELLAGHSGGTRAIQFSRDGLLLFSGGVDGTYPGGASALPISYLRIWRVRDGEALGAYQTHDGAMLSALAVAPEDRYLAAGGSDSAVLVWPMMDLLDSVLGEGCPAADADEHGYLRSICQYIAAAGINVEPGDPAKYAIAGIQPHTYEGRAVDWVHLTCCYLGDSAIIDPETGKVLKFYVGAK